MLERQRVGPRKKDREKEDNGKDRARSTKLCTKQLITNQSLLKGHSSKWMDEVGDISGQL